MIFHIKPNPNPNSDAIFKLWEEFVNRNNGENPRTATEVCELIKQITKAEYLKNKPMKNFIWTKDTPWYKKGESANEFNPQERERLLAEGWIEEVGQWKPKLGEEYWAIDFDYDDGVSKDRWDDLKVDRNRFEAGNYFKTEEDVLAAIEKVKALLLSLHV